jgi:hypothetical protein
MWLGCFFRAIVKSYEAFSSSRLLFSKYFIVSLSSYIWMELLSEVHAKNNDEGWNVI